MRLTTTIQLLRSFLFGHRLLPAFHPTSIGITWAIGILFLGVWIVCCRQLSKSLKKLCAVAERGSKGVDGSWWNGKRWRWRKQKKARRSNLPSSRSDAIDTFSHVFFWPDLKHNEGKDKHTWMHESAQKISKNMCEYILFGLKYNA